MSQNAESVAITVGSYWRKTSTSGVATEGGRFIARVEGLTPLGRPVMRRIDCEHEWVTDSSYLLSDFAPTEPVTAVVFDYNQRAADGRYPWRVKCPVCGWGDTFGSRVDAEERADQHDARHIDSSGVDR